MGANDRFPLARTSGPEIAASFMTSNVLARARRLLAPIGVQWYLAVLVALDAFMILRPVLGRIGFVWRGDWLLNALRIVDTATLLVLSQLLVGVGLATMTIGRIPHVA
jgi:voltage-gated potassium channel